MKCALYYSLYQKAYLADVKGERAEYDRMMGEIRKHMEKCPDCMATLDTAPLEAQLFQAPVRIVS